MSFTDNFTPENLLSSREIFRCYFVNGKQIDVPYHKNIRLIQSIYKIEYECRVDNVKRFYYACKIEMINSATGLVIFEFYRESSKVHDCEPRFKIFKIGDVDWFMNCYSSCKPGFVNLHTMEVYTYDYFVKDHPHFNNMYINDIYPHIDKTGKVTLIMYIEYSGCSGRSDHLEFFDFSNPEDGLKLLNVDNNVHGDDDDEYIYMEGSGHPEQKYEWNSEDQFVMTGIENFVNIVDKDGNFKTFEYWDYVRSQRTTENREIIFLPFCNCDNGCTNDNHKCVEKQYEKQIYQLKIKRCGDNIVVVDLIKTYPLTD